MTIEVKICGLRDRGGARRRARRRRRLRRLRVLRAQPAQHRCRNAARALADKARGKAKVVALLVDPDDALLAEVDRGRRARHRAVARRGDAGARRRDRAALRPPGDEGGDGRRRARTCRRRSPTRAAPTASCSTPRRPQDDAGALPGGNGVAFDWQALAGLEGRIDYMLAGGLDARQRRRGDPPHRRARRRRFLRRREPAGRKGSRADPPLYSRGKDR